MSKVSLVSTRNVVFFSEENKAIKLVVTLFCPSQTVMRDMLLGIFCVVAILLLKTNNFCTYISCNKNKPNSWIQPFWASCNRSS